jgi:hypothetical protein
MTNPSGAATPPASIQLRRSGDHLEPCQRRTVSNGETVARMSLDVEAYRQDEHKRDRAWAGAGDERLAELGRELAWPMLLRARLA